MHRPAAARYWIVGVCAALTAGLARAQTYSAQEAARLRREVTLENWDRWG